MANNMQDSKLCNLCDERTMKARCKVCAVSLCSECVGEHLSDKSTSHDIVTVDSNNSNLRYPRCSRHPDETCDMNCIDCNRLVCPLCVASEEHVHHGFRDILELVNVKRENIANEMECLQKISQSYEEKSVEIENRISNLEEKYMKLTVSVDKQRKTWHKEVDFMADKLKSEIKNMRKKHRLTLKKHRQSIEKLLDDLKTAIEEIKGILDSDDVSESLDFEGKLAGFNKLPPELRITFPIFVPLKVKQMQLRKSFGSLTPPSITYLESVRPPEPNDKPSSNGASPDIPSDQSLLGEPHVVDTIGTGFDFLRNVACAQEGSFWTSNGHAELKRFNTQGSLLETMDTRSGEMACDIAVTDTNDLLYTDIKDRTINKVTNGGIKELIKLPGWNPLNICIAEANDLLVTMYNDERTQSKVVRYAGATEKQTIQFDNEGKPIYSLNNKIKYITENKNSDICVADWGAGAIIVVNHLGEVRFRYRGHPSSSRRRPFKPRGISADSKHQILTVDYHNNCIHVIAPTGSFLRCIDNCRIENPYGISLDQDDKLFVAELYSGKVKTIQYLK